MRNYTARLTLGAEKRLERNTAVNSSTKRGGVAALETLLVARCSCPTCCILSAGGNLIETRECGPDADREETRLIGFEGTMGKASETLSVSG